MTTTEDPTTDPASPPTPTSSSSPTPTSKTFTQDELDRIVQDRLDRERRKFGDYDDLKAKASRFDELDAASKTELERERIAREKAEAKALGLEASTRNAAIRAHAAALGAVDADAVLALVDQTKVTLGDDGQVTGAEEAVKALLDAKPYLVGKPSTPPAGGADGGARPGPPALDPSTMTMEEYVAARRDGRID